MKDIKAVAGLTFKIVVGVKIGKFFADVVTGIMAKTMKVGAEALQLKIENNCEEKKEPHMEVK